MINRFLKAKHWHLFLLTFGLPIIFQIVLMISEIFQSQGAENHGPQTGILNTVVFPLIMVVFIVVTFGWYWSVGVGLQKLVRSDLRMKVSRYKIFLFFAIGYLPFFFFLFVMFVVSRGTEPAIFLVTMPFHLFYMFCIFYTAYFMAKAIKTAELQRKVTFDDFASEFFLMWFFPIGIWIIQPKINKLILAQPTAAEQD